MKFIFLSAFLFSSAAVFAETPREINVPGELRSKIKSFEPSALLYMPEYESYLVASDETNDEPLLFWMNAHGEVDQKPVRFDGLRKMTDIESLSTDGNFIYALSSQSRTKKGNSKTERNLMVRGRIHDGKFRVHDSFELRPVLLKALMLSSDSRIASLRNRFDELLEIEASYVRNGKFYVGLKEPQLRPGVGLVLELGDADQIFRDHEIRGNAFRVAYEVNFGEELRISDIVPSGEGFFITSAKKDRGALWFLDEKGGLQKLRSYAAANPEGVALDPDRNGVLVVFDQKLQNPLYSHEKF